PVNAIVTGYWAKEPALGVQTVKTSLIDNLEPGPIICIAFGSTTRVAWDMALLQKVLSAISSVMLPDQESSTLTVVIVGTGFELDESQFPFRLVRLPEASYETLFPLCRLVIHHGGCGTCADVLRSGVPSIVIPIWLWSDQ